MSGKSKEVLADIGEKKGYIFYKYSNQVIEFSESFKGLKNQLEYLEWALKFSNSINHQLFYFDKDGIAKDQFADPINARIKGIKKLVSIHQKVTAKQTRINLKLEFKTIIQAAIYYYEKYYLSGLVKSEEEALDNAISDIVTVKGKIVSFQQLKKSLDTTFNKYTIFVKDNKVVYTKEYKKLKKRQSE